MNYYSRNTLEFRPEIDVFRAIAVIIVILFHFNIPYFHGGYVGVDMFFVISGYLISRIIITKTEANKFSFYDFFLKRAKRLLPALYFLLLICMPLGYTLFDYISLKDLGKQLISTNLYFSNFLFWRDSGYFELPSILKPLLHTWSLSIEEQFYFFFPIFIYFSYRLGKNYFLVLCIIIFVTSFILNLFGVIHFQSATFYLLPTRAWEFQLGTFIVIFEMKFNLKNKLFGQLIFFVGVIFLLISVFKFSNETIYPGWSSVLPVLGTALLIITGKFIPQLIAKNSILAFIGQISYSLYLWHWPIFAFGKFILMHDPNLLESFLMILLSILIAWLSWKFIENPFRYNFETKKRKVVFISGILLLTLIISFIGFVFYKSNGLPKRSPLNKILINANADTLWDEYVNCGKNFSSGKISNPCIIGKKVQDAKILLWGDSHARALAIGLNEYLTIKGISCYLASLSSTPPLIGLRNSKSKSSGFEMFNNKVLEYIRKNPEIETVILCSRWSYYVNDDYSELELRSRPVFVKTKIFDKSGKLNKSLIFEYGLNNTIDSLIKLGKSVYLVNPVPELNQDVRNLLGNKLVINFLNKKINDYGVEQSDYEVRNRFVLTLFESLSKKQKVKVIQIEKSLFNNKKLMIMDKDKLFYKDDNHLSKYGSIKAINSYNNLFLK